MTRNKSKTSIVSLPQQQNTSDHIIPTNYNMNKTKVAKHKIDASTRPPAVLKSSVGGTTIAFSAAAFQIFSDTVQSYFNPSSQSLQATNIKSTNKLTNDGLTESVSISVTPQKGKNPANRAFTINLYNTTSRALINGKGEKEFLKHYNLFSKHLEKIGSAQLDTLNKSIKEQFKNTLAKSRNNTKSTSQSSPAITSPHSTLHPTENDTCPSCDAKVLDEDKGVLCETCDFWYHLQCTAISHAEYQLYLDDTDRPFICNTCLSLSNDQESAPSQNIPPIAPGSTPALLPSHPSHNTPTTPNTSIPSKPSSSNQTQHTSHSPSVQLPSLSSITITQSDTPPSSLPQTILNPPT
jgi:hypothetical protein